jgi:Fe-S cluster assembly ATP-binding protein
MSRLEVVGLRAAVGGKEILRGIDITVSSGEVHAIMGPNGSGKSTLSHVLMGRPGYEVLAGEVLLDGRDLLALPAWERAAAGLFLAMQYPTEVPGVSLEEMLTEALVATGKAPARAAELGEHSEVHALMTAEAEKIGFDERFLARPLNVDLSGGEKKRNETMQLGVLAPKIAILDEIDSGLDVDALRDVSRRVEQLTTEIGLGVLAITHYRRLLTELRADRIHVLVKGRIVASGGPELADELEVSGYTAFSDGEDDADEGAPAPADPFADPLA